MSRHEKAKSGSFLESWFKGGTAKKAPGSRPASQSMSRPNSETDFGEADDNAIKALEDKIRAMSSKEIEHKFEELLSDMNLNNDKKKPLTLMSIEQKKEMLIMKCRGSNQDTGHKFDKPHEYHAYLDQYTKPEYLSLSKLLNCVESLRIALTNNTLSWVREFGAEGLQRIFKVLDLGLKQ